MTSEYTKRIVAIAKDEDTLGEAIARQIADTASTSYLAKWPAGRESGALAAESAVLTLALGSVLDFIGSHGYDTMQTEALQRLPKTWLAGVNMDLLGKTQRDELAPVVSPHQDAEAYAMGHTGQVQA